MNCGKRTKTERSPRNYLRNVSSRRTMRNSSYWTRRSRRSETNSKNGMNP
jgi:hypothetical protein